MYNRRHFLTSAAGLTATAAALPVNAPAAESEYYVVKNGRIRQSVVHWCFNPMSVEDLAKGAAKMGMQSVELVPPEHWPMLKKLGLTCAIASSHGFSKGFAHTEEHAECIDNLRKGIDDCAAHDVKSIITFSGFTRGMAHETARKNMIDGLKKIVPYAEEKKVTLCLEMLNSRVNENMKGHPDYWCDHIDYALDICKAISSERMKMLFDIYHVQIMDGDVIRRYKQCAEYTGHIHTAGNPGREELDDEQEIHYPGIMKAIVASGYKGFVGQEFIPRNPDKLAALNAGVKLCDV
ncbi:MAG TPA: TIM barrel protein [Verrucomicrobiales bacterium]|jgi:hydroxypyruvate isomerase|nr:TIM barrel protein [Verrucomicrobiales bacterium]